MFYDVMNWLVVYLILLMGFSMLFLGASDYSSLVPGAETCSSGGVERFVDNATHVHQSEFWSIPDSGWTSCHLTYILVRPMVTSPLPCVWIVSLKIRVVPHNEKCAIVCNGESVASAAVM